MNVLVVGGGGREHAIVWCLSKSKKVDKIYCIPGNAGIGQLAECVLSIKATEVEKIVSFVNSHPDIKFTVVAPDDPLALGLVDLLNAEGHFAFGPTKLAAKLEWSKAYAKDFMIKHNIPTADYFTFSDYDAAVEYVRKCKLPVVVKADGLSVGKGALICNTLDEAFQALRSLMVENAFGKSGNTVVIEEFLTGYEVSLLAFCDGNTIIPMPASHDYKRAYDNDLGLNTGGMGNYSPSEKFDERLLNQACEEIVYPTLKALKKEGIVYKGVIYFGLMVTKGGIKVIEYNARFGDPETQVILPSLETDLMDVFLAVEKGELDRINIKFSNNAYVCVVLTSGGYPGEYKVGEEIAVGNIDGDCLLFHSGTKLQDGKLVTNGGRVIGVVSKGATIEQARVRAYENVYKINFNNKHFRSDIAKI